MGRPSKLVPQKLVDQVRSGRLYLFEAAIKAGVSNHTMASRVHLNGHFPMRAKLRQDRLVRALKLSRQMGKIGSLRRVGAKQRPPISGERVRQLLLLVKQPCPDFPQKEKVQDLKGK